MLGKKTVKSNWQCEKMGEGGAQWMDCLPGKPKPWVQSLPLHEEMGNPAHFDSWPHENLTRRWPSTIQNGCLLAWSVLALWLSTSGLQFVGLVASSRLSDWEIETSHDTGE